jgi:hypothetical protein
MTLEIYMVVALTTAIFCVVGFAMGTNRQHKEDAWDFAFYSLVIGLAWPIGLPFLCLGCLFLWIQKQKKR